jgi:hypothetical protein
MFIQHHRVSDEAEAQYALFDNAITSRFCSQNFQTVSFKFEDGPIPRLFKEKILIMRIKAGAALENTTAMSNHTAVILVGSI